MSDKENLDTMAKRYKEEMLRLYRKNPPAPPEEKPPRRPETPAAQDRPAAVSCDSEGCRFLSPEEILSREKADESAAAGGTKDRKTDVNYGSDITHILLDGTGFAPENLVTSGGTDCGEQCAAASAESTGQRFAGILVRTVYTSPVSSAETALPSDVISEVIPEYINLPPDVNETSSVPPLLDASYAVSDKWNKLTGDSGWGYLRFDISTGGNDDPVEGATAVISRRSDDRTILSRILSSGKSGLTSAAALPAPSEKESAGCTPYAVYTAMIFANGYYPIYDMKIRIYPGITTLCPVRLAKLPEARG